MRRFGVQGCVGVGVDVVLFDERCRVPDFFTVGHDLELLHCRYQSLHAIYQVLVYRQSVQRPFFLGVSVLMYDLHLFHNGGLATFTGTYNLGQLYNTTTMSRRHT